MKNKVHKKKVEFEEEVNDFVGLVFHCPECNAEMHLHIAEIKFEPVKIEKWKFGNNPSKMQTNKTNNKEKREILTLSIPLMQRKWTLGL